MGSKLIDKSLAYYLNLPWTYTVEQSDDNKKKIYVVRVNELPGICTDAPSLDQAMELIKEPMTVLSICTWNMAKIFLSRLKKKILKATSHIERRVVAISDKQKRTKRERSLSQVIDNLVDAMLGPT